MLGPFIQEQSMGLRTKRFTSRVSIQTTSFLDHVLGEALKLLHDSKV